MPTVAHLGDQDKVVAQGLHKDDERNQQPYFLVSSTTPLLGMVANNGTPQRPGQHIAMRTPQRPGE